MSGFDDKMLVHLSRQGDHRAYGELVKRYRARIYSVLVRLTRSCPDAENLCQEAFLKAFLSLEKFEERASFSTWLYRIAVNLALNHTEKNKRVVRWDETVHENMLQSDDVQEAIEQTDSLERLRRAIEDLPPRQRAAVLLRDYEGLSFAEVAEALDCPIGTAKANHFHAIRNLRKRLLAEPAACAETETDKGPAPISGDRSS